MVVRAVFLLHAQGELGDGGNEGKGEDQYWKDEDDGLDNAASGVIAGLHEGTQVPLRNEVERYHCERYDERVDHELGNLQHDGIAKGQRECHEAHAQWRQDVAGDFRAAQLVDDEAIDRIRNRYAVDEHHREDGEPVDDCQDDAIAAAEEVSEYREDIFAV